MLEIVDITLRGAVHSDVYDIVDRAFDVMEDIGLEDYQTPFEELAALNETMYLGLAQEAMVNLTKEYIKGILVQHAVWVNDDTTLDEATELVSGILVLNDYSDKTAIIDAARSGLNSVESFAEVMSLVTKYSTEEIMLMCDHVEYSLIKRIIENATVDEDRYVDPAYQEQQIAIRTMVIDIWNILGRPALSIMDFVNNGLPMAMPYNVYCGMIKDVMTGDDYMKIAQTMVICARASEEGLTSVITPIAENMELYVQEPRIITKIDTLIQKYFSEYQRYVESRLFQESASKRAG